ncbi:MAG TPA: MBL fold metallo-hydrolase [Solirubrobacterales bacterium]|nr:MBL fold metallo-hydrolase [Solirubrobacterales bacterium]
MGTSIGETTPLGDPVAFAGGVVEIGERTWAWIQPNGGLGESNAGLVIGDGAALLVDTLWDEQLTAAMLAAFAPVCERAGAPIEHLFNTHGDGDHWYGNGLLGAGVETVASAPAIEQMRAEPPSMLTRLAPVGTIAGLAGRVPLLPGAGRLRGLAAFGSMLDAYESGGAHPRVPERSFAAGMELDVGGRRVELSFVGPAHTIGDTIAWVPDARVVFAGDILFSGVTPIMWAGPVANWIAALERIEALEPRVVVGGHGPIGGIAEVAALRDYWAWLRDRVRAAGDGVDAMALAERLVHSSEFDPYRSWPNPERIYVNVARIAATEHGGSSEIGTLERIKLIAAMGELGEKL